MSFLIQQILQLSYSKYTNYEFGKKIVILETFCIVIRNCNWFDLIACQSFTASSIWKLPSVIVSITGANGYISFDYNSNDFGVVDKAGST